VKGFRAYFTTDEARDEFVAWLEGTGLVAIDLVCEEDVSSPDSDSGTLMSAAYFSEVSESTLKRAAKRALDVSKARDVRPARAVLSEELKEPSVETKAPQVVFTRGDGGMRRRF
jgi:hypothetical protein